MKHKDLYKHIREEIINTLSEAELDIPTNSGTSDSASSDQKAQAQKASSSGDTVKYVKKGEVDEMARTSVYIKVNDKDKFQLAKEIYTTGKVAAILKAIEEAGEQGLTQNQLAPIIGVKTVQEINPFINALSASGAISRPKPEKATKPEKPEEENPEDIYSTEEEPEDIYGKEDEPEEKSEEEPKTVSKTDTSMADDIEKLAQLKAKLKDIMKKYKDASGKISDINKYKEEVGDIPQQIKTLQAKIG